MRGNVHVSNSPWHLCVLRHVWRAFVPSVLFSWSPNVLLTSAPYDTHSFWHYGCPETDRLGGPWPYLIASSIVFCWTIDFKSFQSVTSGKYLKEFWLFSGSKSRWNVVYVYVITFDPIANIVINLSVIFIVKIYYTFSCIKIEKRTLIVSVTIFLLHRLVLKLKV